MTAQFLIVDASTLQVLWQIGGYQALDTLFKQPYPVVVTQDVIDEIRNYTGAGQVQTWVSNHQSIVRPNYFDPQKASAKAAFDARIITQAEYDSLADQAGDRSIKALASGRELDGNVLSNRPNQQALNAVDEIAPGGAKFQVLTDDQNFIRNIQSDSGYYKSANLDNLGYFEAPYENSLHYLDNLKGNDKITALQLTQWAQNYTGTTYFQQHLSQSDQGKVEKFLLNQSEISAHNPSLTQNKIGLGTAYKFVPAAIIVGAVEVARQAGILGDILSFGITAAHAADLRKEEKIYGPEGANEAWVKYLFETAGGVAGGALGLFGFAALSKGAGGIWAPIAGAIVGSLGGSWGGAALGEKFYRAYPEVFDPLFDKIYAEFDALIAQDVSAAEAFGKAFLQQLGFDLTTTIGSEQADWLVATKWEKRDGSGGDDLLIGWNAEYIAAGEKVDPSNPDSQLAETDLLMLLDGGTGDDWLITLGGDGAILMGGPGEDVLIGWSGEDHLYGDYENGPFDNEEDWYFISHRTFIHNAGVEDHVFLGPFLATGGRPGLSCVNRCILEAAR